MTVRTTRFVSFTKEDILTYSTSFTPLWEPILNHCHATPTKHRTVRNIRSAVDGTFYYGEVANKVGLRTCQLSHRAHQLSLLNVFMDGEFVYWQNWDHSALSSTYFPLFNSVRHIRTLLWRGTSPMTLSPVAAIGTTIGGSIIREFVRLDVLTGVTLVWLVFSSTTDVLITLALVWYLVWRNVGLAVPCGTDSHA